ncbi:IS200/IS605-like element ISH22 family transposase [Nonomuraea maheshkhaliensis]|uniref:IS200/IS605-like element ISH22 family transposase n=1 Tax=Nonomuraea maheshkhaliensis TaxID=419590 RepID=A0ABN2FTZ0_9ACTN
MTRQVRTCPGAAYDLGYHVVWCAKYRRPAPGGRVKDRLEELIRAKADEHGREIVALEMMPEHVRLFVEPHPESSSSYVAGQFKGFTSHRPRAEFGRLRSRPLTLWSRSCVVARVGAVGAETVQRYVETRDERSQGGGRA